MKILLASGNNHKKEELNKILKNHTLILPAELGITIDVEETGSTFLENSIIKAEALFELSQGLPVLADDSGIVVDALNGAPGIYSARYGDNEAGRILSSKEKYELLLLNMDGKTNRKAAFICCMTLILDKNRVFTVQESFEGEISHEPFGDGGFGYDPIFYLPELNKSAAELLDEEKNRISHRGKAGKLINSLLELAI